MIKISDSRYSVPTLPTTTKSCYVDCSLQELFSKTFGRKQLVPNMRDSNPPVAPVAVHKFRPNNAGYCLQIGAPPTAK